MSVHKSAIPSNLSNEIDSGALAQSEDTKSLGESKSLSAVPSKPLEDSIRAELYPRLGGNWTQEQEDEAVSALTTLFNKQIVAELQKLVDDDVLVYWNDDRDEDGHIFISDLKKRIKELERGAE